MVQYKLVYFDMPGRAEISRLIFSAAGQEFEDCRIAGADWPKMKATTMFGQLPLLFVDGKELPQSNAIARYLARTFSNVLVVVRQETGVMYKDLVGGSDWEAAYCDALVDGIWDVNNALGPWWGEKDEAKKELLRRAEEQKELRRLAKPKYSYDRNRKVATAEVSARPNQVRCLRCRRVITAWRTTQFGHRRLQVKRLWVHLRTHDGVKIPPGGLWSELESCFAEVVEERRRNPAFCQKTRLRLANGTSALLNFSSFLPDESLAMSTSSFRDPNSTALSALSAALDNMETSTPQLDQKTSTTSSGDPNVSSAMDLMEPSCDQKINA